MLKPLGAVISRPRPEMMPGRDRAVEAERVADRDRRVADLHRVGVGERERPQLRRDLRGVDLQHRDVRGLVAAEHLRVDRLAGVVEDHLRRLLAVDDVGVGDDRAVVLDHEAGARAVAGADLHDAGRDRRSRSRRCGPAGAAAPVAAGSARGRLLRRRRRRRSARRRVRRAAARARRARRSGRACGAAGGRRPRRRVGAGRSGVGWGSSQARSGSRAAGSAQSLRTRRHVGAAWRARLKRGCGSRCDAAQNESRSRIPDAAQARGGVRVGPGLYRVRWPEGVTCGS